MVKIEERKKNEGNECRDRGRKLNEEMEVKRRD